MQSIHVDTVFWKQEKGEGQSLKIQSILFICDIPILIQNLPFLKIFKTEFPINGCRKCDHPLQVPSLWLLERLAISIPLAFGGCVSLKHTGLSQVSQSWPQRGRAELPPTSAPLPVPLAPPHALQGLSQRKPVRHQWVQPQHLNTLGTRVP